MGTPIPQIIEVDAAELAAFRERAVNGTLGGDDSWLALQLVDAYGQFLQIIEGKTLSISRLHKMIFGASTETTENVLGKSADADADGMPQGADSSAQAPPEDPPKKRKGHGRNGADAYPGAKKVAVPHESLEAGDACPECEGGTVYDTRRPGVLIRIVGQAPLQATVYELEKLRCSLCGVVFTAQAPAEVGPDKYDASSGTMIALLKYGSGMPFHRLQKLQASLGIPLPAATQWDIVDAKAQRIRPAYLELIRQAALGQVLYNDDTGAKILALMGKRLATVFLADLQPEQGSAKERTGVFTSGIVSTFEGRQIALFFTGRQHAGENLRDVLKHRAADLPRPIQMCDALSRNMPVDLQTIVANCLAHGRRNFVDVVESFPAECRYVLEALNDVYKNDAEACKQQMTDDERLAFHRVHSRPIMERLEAWLKRQFDERLVEPNSGLGQAISYMLKHWEKLTLFLHKAGAPLDNNVCERALKKAILHRKNALFYKTQNGANVADLFMSLIYTCELGGVNPFDYLNELELHAAELAAAPQDWMPWSYQATLAGSIAVQGSLAEPVA